MIFSQVPRLFISLFITFILFIQKVSADETTTSLPIITTTLTTDSSTITTTTISHSPTLIWVTGTNSEGVTKTTESIYTQKFSSFYSTVAVPPSGSIGLGTISGTVGTVRTYPIVTFNS